MRSDKTTNVRGHECEGLTRLISEATGCAPIISDNGYIEGCDADNEVPIVFCPMCGVRLPEPTPGGSWRFYEPPVQKSPASVI